MKLWTLITSAVFAISMSLPASAAFVYTDWKNTGDKAAILDSNTGIEWLRLDHVNKKSMAQILSELSTVYAGWRLPTNDEVTALMTGIYGGANMEFTNTTSRSGTYRNGANAFINMMSNGYKTTAHHVGLYYDENGVVRLAGAYANEGGAYTISYGLSYGATLNENSVLSHYRAGVFLVSDGGTTLSSINDPFLNVNNPNAPINSEAPADVSASSLAGIGVLSLGLMMIRRRKQHA